MLRTGKMEPGLLYLRSEPVLGAARWDRVEAARRVGLPWPLPSACSTEPVCCEVRGHQHPRAAGCPTLRAVTPCVGLTSPSRKTLKSQSLFLLRTVIGACVLLVPDQTCPQQGGMLGEVTCAPGLGRVTLGRRCGRQDLCPPSTLPPSAGLARCPRQDGGTTPHPGGPACSGPHRGSSHF